MIIVMNFVLVVATATVDGIKLDEMFYLCFFSHITFYESSIMLDLIFRINVKK